jgi:tRNA threonylcarbamoyl adenosine modification protein (Sua5/YciO/YrdC/YwlC family)
MLIEINPHNQDQRLIEEVVDTLRNGGLIIFPTDTVYAMGCDLYHKKALNKLAALKGIPLRKANFSIICSSLSSLSEYTKHVDRPTYKLLNKSLPGPFTFILQAANEIPRIFDTNKKEVGIRIPDNEILRKIVEELGNPIATTSLHDDEDEILDYFVDPYEIYQRYDDKVDLIIDGGYGNLEASTVVDCTGEDAVILRQGIGEIEV